MMNLRLRCAALLLPLRLFAQQSGTLHGILTDPSGTPIAAVPVSLSSPVLNRTMATLADGAFTFTALPPGGYTLYVDHPGLEPYTSQVIVEAGRRLEFPIQLRLRVATQEVTVSGESATELSTDPSQSAGATVVKGSDLDALPDDLDDLTDLLSILAGPASAGSGSPQILVDGFSGGKLPPKSTIKEIRMNQNRFSTANEWPGAQIEIITKPGADKLHGSVSFADSQAVFNSRNPYSANKADFLNRTIDGTIGDSLRKRASWLVGFYRKTIDNTALINAVTLDAGSLAEVPVRTSVVTPRSDISGTARLDVQLSAGHTFSGTYRILQSEKQNNGIGQYSLLSRAYDTESSAHELRLAETATLSPHLVTETRFGFVRYSGFQYGDTLQPSVIVAGSFSGGGGQIGRASNIDRQFEVQNNSTFVRKSHTITFGGRLRSNPVDNISPSNFGGMFSFFGVSSAPVLDSGNQPVPGKTADISSLEQYRRTQLFQSLHYTLEQIRSLGGGASQFSIAAGNPEVKFTQADLMVYINDEWRPRPSLTFSAGLRYEYQNNVPDSRDFAPRFSAAWSPHAKTGATPKTVLRAGWGIFYNRIGPAVAMQVDRFNGVTQQQYIVPDPDFYPAVPPVSSLAPLRTQSIYQLDPHLRAAGSLYGEIAVERQLPGKTTLTVSYTNQRTNHSFYRQAVNINAPLPATGLRPLGADAGNIFQIESGITQKVQWAAFHAVSHPSRRISLTADYSLWDAHNDGDYDPNACGAAFTTCPSDPYNRAADWARASWTGPWYATAFGSFAAPWGLQLSPIFIARPGQIYNIVTGVDRNGDTVTNDRPAFATDRSRPSVVFTQFGAFDTLPQAGQTIVPRNYLMGATVWGLNLRLTKTFALGPPREAPPPGSRGPAQHRYELSFSVETLNLTNHYNQGGYVGNLASPLFGQSTAIGVYQDTSNNRKVQLGAQLTF